MNIFPAIDLYGCKAIRLYKGNYDQMTIYSEHPAEVAADFEKSGCGFIHLVDLEGAKNGDTPNFDTVKKICGSTSLFAEVGGGIRSMETVRKYFEAGVGRVIIGTAAVRDQDFLKKAVSEYGDGIAVGADVRDGRISIRGWTENTGYGLEEFCSMMREIGIRYMICTDISKDGAMKGTNREMYRMLSEKFDMNFTASGGISTLDDIRVLKQYGLYGAIIGKAYYTGAISLRDALEAAQ